MSKAWAGEMAEIFKAEMARGKREGEVKLEVKGVGEYGNYDSKFCFHFFPVYIFAGMREAMVI